MRRFGTSGAAPNWRSEFNVAGDVTGESPALPAWTREGYEITTDRARVDLTAVHRYLSEDSYWAKNVPRDVVERAIGNSITFAILHESKLAGFARVTSDRATFAYLADVFVLPAHRGKGLSKWLMECISSHPELQGLRRWMLATQDAHGLYTQFGFSPLKSAERWMEKHRPDVYAKAKP